MSAMQKLQATGKCAVAIVDIKELLNMAGFSQNGRNRIIHLSGEEINALCKNSPKDEGQWYLYVNEIQKLLSKMDQARKVNPYLGRPYVTTRLAGTTRKLSSLRHEYEKGNDALQVSKIRSLLMDHEGQLAHGYTGGSIQIQSAIQFLELYRDELLMPPRFESKPTFDDYTLHEIETGDFHWMDDGGRSYLEDIRDMPMFTLQDVMPDFPSVADWFIATKPVFDHNQIRQGWSYMEKLSEEWHQCDGSWDSYAEIISEYQYPSWSCAVADRQGAWLAALPPDNPYKPVPLTTPQQLLEESKMMHHCVVTYIDSCISGEVRVFSVRDARNNQRIATAELSVRSGRWVVVQLKGKHNQELIQRTHVPGDPLAVILNVLVNWYNAVTPEACLVN
jgi:hypothetical protein